MKTLHHLLLIVFLTFFFLTSCTEEVTKNETVKDPTDSIPDSGGDDDKPDDAATEEQFSLIMSLKENEKYSIRHFDYPANSFRGNGYQSERFVTLIDTHVKGSAVFNLEKSGFTLNINKLDENLNKVLETKFYSENAYSRLVAIGDNILVVGQHFDLPDVGIKIFDGSTLDSIGYVTVPGIWRVSAMTATDDFLFLYCNDCNPANFWVIDSNGTVVSSNLLDFFSLDLGSVDGTDVFSLQHSSYIILGPNGSHSNPVEIPVFGSLSVRPNPLTPSVAFDWQDSLMYYFTMAAQPAPHPFSSLSKFNMVSKESTPLVSWATNPNFFDEYYSSLLYEAKNEFLILGMANTGGGSVRILKNDGTNLLDIPLSIPPFEIFIQH